jgi:cytochrome c553
MAMLLTGCNAAPDVAPVQQFAALAAADLASEGKRIAHILGCFGCHGSNLEGALWDEKPEFGIIAPSNLTRSAARYSDAALERMIREGVRPDGSVLWEIPSEAFTKLSDADMKALLAFLKSVPASGPDRPRPTFGAGAREEIGEGELLSAPQKVALERALKPWAGGNRHESGRYVAQMACGECHGPTLGGNETPFRPDLIVAGNYSLDAFRQLLRTGETADGRDLGLMGEVAKSRFSHLADDEVEALYRYLVARAQSPDR